MKDFRELKVWEKAHLLVLAVYKATSSFPRQELYSLTNQIQRAVVSLPTNIAEGCGKSGDADFSRYLQIAMGSSSELEYLLLLAHDLTYLPDETYISLSGQLVEARKMLNALIQKPKSQPLTAKSYHPTAINFYLLMPLTLWYKDIALLCSRCCTSVLSQHP